MQSNLEKLEQIYVSDDVDEETRADNLAIIQEWRSKLIKLDEYERWKSHPVTEEIIARAKKSYVEHSLLLARSRELTDVERCQLWGKQDAMLWLISLASTDEAASIAEIEALIERALSET